MADHLEVLYDLDVEVAGIAAEVGLAYARTASSTTTRAFIATLADLIVAADGGSLTWRARAGRRRRRWHQRPGRGLGADAAAQTPRADAPTVTVLEASPRLGGPLRSATFGGRVVDLGPDGFLGRRPEAVDLCREVGLGDGARCPIAARGASVLGPRPPAHLCPRARPSGSPPGSGPTARSGILGLRGALGLARDALLPRPDVRGPIGDRAIGPLVSRKLGRRVVDMLADPLIGGIHAGSVDDMSAAATFPPLLAAAQRRGGLMRGLRAEVPAPDPDGPPLFWALDGGMASLVDALGGGLRERGVDIRSSSPAERLERAGPHAGWTVAAAGTAPSRRTPWCWPRRRRRRRRSSAPTTTRWPASSRPSTTPPSCW